MQHLSKIAGLLSILLLTLTFYSQNKDKIKKSDVPFEIKANVLVTDPAENLVNNLNPEDFKIYEDGIEQKITSFAVKQPVLNLALAFDNSGSIRPHLDEITKAGKIIVANLRDKDEAFVVRFTSSDVIEVIQNYTNNKSDLTEAVDNLFVSAGQTAVLDTVYLSAEKLIAREKKAKSNRYAIVLFSDVEDRDSYYKLKDVLQLIKGTDLQVFLISYAQSAPEKKKQALNLTHTLTRLTGGTAYLIERKHVADDITSVLKSLVYELRSQYIIGYTSTNLLLDGAPRKITIQVADSAKGEKRQSFIRDNYIIPKK